MVAVEVKVFRVSRPGFDLPQGFFSHARTR